MLNHTDMSKYCEERRSRKVRKQRITLLKETVKFTLIIGLLVVGMKMAYIADGMQSTARNAYQVAEIR